MEAAEEQIGWWRAATTTLRACTDLVTAEIHQGAIEARSFAE
jgi:hypothetical protein